MATSELRQIASALTVGVLTSLAPASDLPAQEVSAHDAVLCFERQAGAFPDRLIACADDVVPASAIILDADDYSPRLIEAVLDELALVAVSTDSDVVRTGAVQWIAYLGRTDTGRGNAPRPGIVARLERLYDDAENLTNLRSARRLQRMVIHMMGKQAETTRAVGFLEATAQRPPQYRTSEPMSVLATKTLARMGPAGAASLSRLREQAHQEN